MATSPFPHPHGSTGYKFLVSSVQTKYLSTSDTRKLVGVKEILKISGGPNLDKEDKINFSYYAEHITKLSKEFGLDSIQEIFYDLFNKR